MNETMVLPVDEKRLAEFTRILQKYKAGKASVERRAVAAENWWKLRNSAEERKSTEGGDGFQAASGWLHNVIVSKHADAMDAYPEPNILPREPGDRQEAWVLPGNTITTGAPCSPKSLALAGTYRMASRGSSTPSSL